MQSRFSVEYAHWACCHQLHNIGNLGRYKSRLPANLLCFTSQPCLSARYLALPLDAAMSLDCVDKLRAADTAFLFPCTFSFFRYTQPNHHIPDRTESTLQAFRMPTAAVKPPYSFHQDNHHKTSHPSSDGSAIDLDYDPPTLLPARPPPRGSFSPGNLCPPGRPTL